MFNLSVFIGVFLFLGYIWLTGKGMADILGINKRSSSLFYGFVFFFALFWIISIPFQILGLNWDLYTNIMTTVLFCYPVVISLIYIWQIKKKKQSFSIEFNWVDFGIAVIYLTFAFVFYYKNLYNIIPIFDSGLMWNGIVRDDFLYTNLATQMIDQEGMFANFEAVNYFGTTIDSLAFDRKIAIAETFNAFMSTKLDIKPIEFSRLYMPFIFYLMVFTTIKEMVFQVTNKKSFIFLIGIAVFLLVSPSGETLKFLITPWYGNLINIFIMPSVMIIIYTLFCSEKIKIITKLVLFFAGSIFVNSFAAISAFGYLALLIVFVISYILNNDVKYKWLIISVFTISIFGIMHIIASLGGGYELATTRQLFVDARMYVLAFIALFILYISKNEECKKYKIYFMSLIFIVILCYIPYVNSYLFSTYSFIYKRFIDMIIFQTVIWGSFFISEFLFLDYYKKLFINRILIYLGCLLSTLLIFYVAYDRGVNKLYLQTLDDSALTYEYKVHPLVRELADEILLDESGRLLVNNYATNQTRIPFLEFTSMINPNIIVESLYQFTGEYPYDFYNKLDKSDYENKLDENDFYITIDQNEAEELINQNNVKVIEIIPQQYELVDDLYVLDLRSFTK